MVSIKDLMNLQGRTAFVTGATGGLGKVISRTLAELGADLLLVDRPGSDFSDVIENISRYGVTPRSLECDIEKEVDRKVLIEKIKNEAKDLSILVNNAAFVGSSELAGWAVPFEKQLLETWRRALEVNLTAAFDFCQGLAPIMMKTPGSNIINIASIYGEVAPDWQLYEGTNMGNPAAYAASKAGLIQLTRWLSTALAPNIRVNAISPGGIWRNQPQVFVERYESRTPLGRMAKEEDFVGAIAFLASDQAGYVTGQNIIIDGGWCAC